MRVTSEKEAIEKINEIKKEFRDARHHVFAYRLANSNERFSDDGEPSGTAGVPILDILRGEKIENVLVVVTRYFGGILLGTGGLVKAYSTAAKEAILEVKKVEMRLCTEYKITIDYNYYDILNHYLRKNEIVIKNVDYSEKINVFVIVEKGKSEKVLKEIEDITDRTYTSSIIDTYYYI
jgi:uncharacterized YigZ family protein